jgi:hypothetical protein
MGNPKQRRVEKIISGGQTGADRAALEWSVRNHFAHGGWCPKGRRAEDGRLPAKYHLTETTSDEYAVRTEWNVRDSDGTVIFSLGESLLGGSLTTLEAALRLGRPFLHLRAADGPRAAQLLSNWVEENNIRVLNVAGPRASEEAEIGSFVQRTLSAALLEHGTASRAT